MCEVISLGRVATGNVRGWESGGGGGVEGRWGEEGRGGGVYI